MFRVEIYVSTCDQYTRNFDNPLNCKPIGAEVATTIVHHLKWLINNRVSFGRKLVDTLLNEQNIDDDLSSGAWHITYIFRSLRTAKSLFRNLPIIFQETTRGVVFTPSSADETFATFHCSIEISKEEYFGHLLVQIYHE